MGLSKRWAALLCCILAASGTAANAAGFPDHPVHFFVGLAPGGGTDTLTRLIAQKLSEKWGQPVIVENKPGSSGTIAADFVSRAPADGYSVAWITNAHTVTATLNQLNYDPIKSFAPVMQVAYIPDVLLVNPALGVNSLKELVALAKSKPGKLNYSSPGNGSAPHLEAEFLSNLTDSKMVHIAFTGGPEAVTSLLGGETQLYFAAASTAIGQVSSGKLKALAVSTNVRSAMFPDVPTVAEALGIAHFEAANSDWTGVLAPAGTPADVVNKLNRDMAEVIALPDTQERLAKIGFVPIANTPEQFTETMKSEIVRWAGLLKTIGVK